MSDTLEDDIPLSDQFALGNIDAINIYLRDSDRTLERLRGTLDSCQENVSVARQTYLANTRAYSKQVMENQRLSATNELLRRRNVEMLAAYQTILDYNLQLRESLAESTEGSNNLRSERVDLRRRVHEQELKIREQDSAIRQSKDYIETLKLEISRCQRHRSSFCDRSNDSEHSSTVIQDSPMSELHHTTDQGA
ncbi:hypothetical protein Plec18170_009711 [Paecilomyces lecythidis]